MDNWLSFGAGLLTALAAVLAWVTKLWWTKEQVLAKDERIKSKDDYIARLKWELDEVLTMREYWSSKLEFLQKTNEELRINKDNLEKILGEERDFLRRKNNSLCREIEDLRDSLISVKKEIEIMDKRMGGDWY